MKRWITILFLVAPGLAADLKTAEAVLDRFIEMTGGADAYGKIHNRVQTGTISMPAMGVKGDVNVFEAEPAKIKLVSEIQGVGKMSEGSDGKIAWAYSALQGPQLKSGEELDASLREAFFQKETGWRSIYAKAELTGMEDVDGKPAYKVVLTPKSGKPETHFYDKESGLLVRQAGVRKTAMGDIPVDVAVSAYRKECGVSVPHSLTQSFAGQKVLLEVSAVECNKDLPADAFDPPADVKALIK